jgi:acyl-CoA thioesterase-1
MMGSDMDDVGSSFGSRSTRRRWLAHCSLLVAAAPVRALSALPRTILVVGDSLSAEYGLPRGAGWVALLEKRLAGEKIDARVVNASISGETTSGGRSRIASLLKEHRPTHVVIELGGNDALRGLPLAMTQANLAEMARAARSAGAKVVVAGMQLPPNYGKRYGDDFAALFGQVAKAEGAALVPFFLEGVGDVPDAERVFFQPDRIHPNEKAQPLLLDNVWAVLRPLLK